MAPTRAARARKTTPARKGVETAERILEAAIRLFSRGGFDGTSTTEIALAAGVAQPAVLYHFESKDALWYAAMDRLFARVYAEFGHDRDALRDLSSVDRIKVWIRQFVLTSATHPELGRVMAREATAGGPRLKWLVNKYLKRDYELYETHFKRAMAEGQLRMQPPFLLTILVHSAASMLFTLSPLVEAASGRSPFQKDVVAAQANLVIDVIFNGLLTRKEN